jgi:HlyD family secretion protein
MPLLNFLRRKKAYLILGVLVVGIAAIWLWSSRTKQPVYETSAVERRDLIQTVEVTGEIKPAARIDLSFKNGGTVDALRVKVGQLVKQGDVLAVLKGDDVTYAAKSAEAALAVAVANLQAKLAGETPEAIRVAETDVQQAQAAYNKALADLESAKLTTVNDLSSAELDVTSAKNNLDNQKAIQAQTVRNTYDSARAKLLTALGPLQTGLTDGDQIIGVDDTAANQSFKNVLGILLSGSMERAQDSYKIAKAAKATAETATSKLTSNSDNAAIQAAGDLIVDAINKTQTYLTDVQKVLAASITSVNLTLTTLDTKKALIDTDRTSISTQYTTVQTALQSTTSAELTRTEAIQKLEDAYQATITALATAKTDAITEVLAAQTQVEIKKAALDSSEASLKLKRSDPRPVDVASLRASIQQARANYEKALNDVKGLQIIAPVDGVIAEILPDTGERVTANQTIVTMVGSDGYDIEVMVPETDIAKIQVGQSADITLDAYGDDVIFKGAVTSENPDQTLVQDAVYYIVRVQITTDGKDIKPGMTANVTVKTGESLNVLVIPLRAVRTQPDGAKTVRVLANNQAVQRTIQLGLRGDEGRIEVLQGLEVGEWVITGETLP